MLRYSLALLLAATPYGSFAALLLCLPSTAPAQEAAPGSSRPAARVVIVAAGIVRPSTGKTPALDTPPPLRLDDILALLQAPIDTQVFQAGMKLDQALARLSALCKARGKELVFVLNRDAFSEENPDAPETLETEVRLPAYPRRLRFADALRFLLARVPTNNATFLVRHGAIEITTRDRAALPQLLAQRVTVRFQRVQLAEALYALAEESGISIVVDVRMAERTRTVVSLNLADTGVWNALYPLLHMGGLRAVLVGNVLYVTSPEEAARVQRELIGAALRSQDWPEARSVKLKSVAAGVSQ